MSRYIPTLKVWPLGTPLPRNGMFVFYDPAQDDEFRVLPEQVGGTGGNLPLNDAKSGQKFYRYRTRFEAEQLGAYGGAVLEELDYLTLCTFARLVVERYREDPNDLSEQPHYQELVAVYSGEPHAPRGYRDGSFEGDLIGLQLVKLEDFRPPVDTSNIPPLDPTRTNYPQYFTVQRPYAGKVALLRTRNPGGPFPAPPTAAGDNNWQPVAEPVAPTALAQSLTLAEASGMDTDNVQAGRSYLITGAWNGGDPAQTVTVLGISNLSFSVVGVLELNGVRTAVKNVNVLAGTFELDDAAPVSAFELRYQATTGAVRLGFDTLAAAHAAAPLLRPATVLIWPGRTDLGNGEYGHLMPAGDTGVVRKNLTLCLMGGTIVKFPANGQLLVNGWQDFSSPAATLTITGPGKLIGTVFVAGNLNTTRLLINCRHDGYVYVNYTNLNGKTNADELRVGPAGYVTNTGSSGGYFKLLTGYVGFYGGNAVNLHFDRCRAELTTLVERQLSAPADAPTLTISSALLVPAVSGDVAGVPTTYVSATPGGDGGTDLQTVNTYALTGAKRKAVADTLIAQVAQGGQAWLLEPDGRFLGQVIVDNRTATERSIITCHQQDNPTTGATEFCWYRSVVQ